MAAGALMTTQDPSEQARYFEAFSRRVIDRAAQLCAVARHKRSDGAAGNPSGLDLEQADLDMIAAVTAGVADGLTPWQTAQAHELSFWRSVAWNGYDGKDPLMFPLLQEHFLVNTFYKTGWAMADFRDAAVLEIGCGPLGMIEYLPALRRVGLDPLNEKYNRLFANFRSVDIEYVTDIDQVVADDALFDLVICHNVIDHAAEPAELFNILFGKAAMGGRFIFQVNLSRPGFPQSASHRRLHPAPLAFEQVVEWLAAKSDDFTYHQRAEPTADNEFYFLSWGTKMRDTTVAYRAPPIELTATEAATDGVPQPGLDPGSGPPQATQLCPGPPPLISKATSAWASSIALNGSPQPFANLPAIAELASEAALQQQAGADFAISEPIAGYRARDTAPIPVAADREGYYGENHSGYWLSGLSDALSVTRQAERLGLGANPRYFELGCASGRVVRHVAFHTAVPITCCDINKRHTEWIRLFLPQRINVFQSSVIPALPLEDNSVDIATAFSVFTHIDEFDTAWLLELRRILRPGGLAYVSVATDHTWEQYRQQWIKDHLLPLAGKITDFTVDEALFAGPLPREKTVFWWGAGRAGVYASTVFHTAAYIRREWGRIFTVRDILPDRHFYQDVVLMTK